MSIQQTQTLQIDIQGPANVPTIEVADGPVTVGRHANNQVVLGDAQASRAHCVLEPAKGKSGGFQVRDLNSSNGTYLNGQRVTGAAPLKPGDVVTIGATRLVARDPLAAPAAVEEVDELSEADVVEEFVQVQDSERITLGNAEGDYEEALVAMAAALPAGEFAEHEIALANAKGRIVHEAGTQERRAGARRDIVGIFRLVLLNAFRSRTTDIHLEPRKDGYIVRLRLDGVLVDACTLPHQTGVRLASLVKVLGEIDLAMRDSIQEGSFSSRVPSGKDVGGFRRVDYRVSFAPAVFGQKLVLRVLDTANAPSKINDLGLPLFMGKALAEAISQDAGMVLVAGPTGSGKTSTLYSLIRSIDSSQRNVVTIEDPVEIQLDGVTQIQVDDAGGKSFGNILRSVLRQDPDVILVGEIRDGETARIAMQAAITGHLVFSTVHTKDTAGSIFRLLDLGCEPYMVGQGLHMVVAQRLVRTLCPNCKRPVKPTPQQLEQLGPKYANLQRLFEPGGCKRCLGTGYFGRRAVFELLENNDKLKDTILRSPTIQDVYEAATNGGGQFQRLMQSGYDLAARGVVSLTEVERAVGR